MRFSDEERHQQLLDTKFLLQQAIQMQEGMELDEVDERLLEINKRGLENINRLIAESEERQR